MADAEIMLGMGSSQHYYVILSLIGQAHTQNDPCNEIPWNILDLNTLRLGDTYMSLNYIISSGNDLLPVAHQAITWNVSGWLSVGALRTTISKIWFQINDFSFKQSLQNGSHFVLVSLS